MEIEKNVSMSLGDGEKKPQVPEGIYVASFLGTEKVPPKEHAGKMMAEGRKWWFEIAEGEHAGRKVDNIGTCGDKPGASSISGKMFAGLGKPANLDAVIGKKFRIVVSANGNGRHVVQQVFAV